MTDWQGMIAEVTHRFQDMVQTHPVGTAVSVIVVAAVAVAALTGSRSRQRRAATVDQGPPGSLTDRFDSDVPAQRPKRSPTVAGLVAAGFFVLAGGAARYIEMISIYDASPAEALQSAEWVAAIAAAGAGVVTILYYLFGWNVRVGSRALLGRPPARAKNPFSTLQICVAAVLFGFMAFDAAFKHDPAMAPILAKGHMVFLIGATGLVAWLFWSVFFAKTNSR